MSNARTTTAQTTSQILLYLKATFNSPEPHPRAQPLRAFYAAIKECVESVRTSVENADVDPAFKKAAAIFSKVASSCEDMEIVDPATAGEMMASWVREMKNIGTDGVMDVEGIASKMLAERYGNLLQKMANEEFWPVPTTPRLIGGIVGPSLATVYAINFKETTKASTEQTIQTLKQRIKTFDEKNSAEKAEMIPDAETSSRLTRKF